MLGETVCKPMDAPPITTVWVVRFTSNFAGVAIHCSFGAASLEPGETEEDFLNRVDGLLYEAKRKGKNQVSY
jgi:PleD family two-component response regulator